MTIFTLVIYTVAVYGAGFLSALIFTAIKLGNQELERWLR